MLLGVLYVLFVAPAASQYTLLDCAASQVGGRWGGARGLPMAPRYQMDDCSARGGIDPGGAGPRKQPSAKTVTDVRRMKDKANAVRNQTRKQTKKLLCHSIQYTNLMKSSRQFSADPAIF